MATEHYSQEAAISPDFKDCKSLSSAVDDSEINSSGDFECNICLDVVKDPVITFCGHLYCWPCIYRWITFPNTSSENPDELQKPQCPVCKAEVSEKTLIPLYGRGQTTNSSKDKVSEHGTVVPKRPFCPSRTFPQIRHQSYIQSSPQPYNPHPGAYTGSSMIGIGGTTTNSIDPMVGMIGEMVYTRIFGNDETLFTYPDLYRLASSSSRRMRRRIMQTDRSLSRVYFFLWCCVILCLLLF